MSELTKYKKPNQGSLKMCNGCNSPNMPHRKNQYICIICENNNVVYLKSCEVCLETKQSTEYSDRRNHCKECEKSRGRNYRRTTTTAKEWVENNRERMAELQHNHYEEHKPEIRATAAARLRDDDLLRMLKSYKGTIGDMISGRTQSNKKLAINRNFYIKWLQFNFTEEMNINNHYAVWHVDHVLALDILSKRKVNGITFDIDSDLSALLRWFNTKPVLAKVNLSKNKYFDKEYTAKHLINLEKYIKIEGFKLDQAFYDYKRIVQLVLDNK